MIKIIVNEERCKACGLCVDVCPQKILKLSSETFNKLGYHYLEVERSDACTGCKRCVTMCPDVVIELYRTDPKPENRPADAPREAGKENPAQEKPGQAAG